MPRDVHSLPPDTETAALDLDRSPRARHLDCHESQDCVTAMTMVLFLGAAVAFKLSVLLGGSSPVFMVGAVCLAMSLGSLVDSRLSPPP